MRKKKKKILSIILMPEHQFKMMELKVGAFICHISMKDDKYHVSNSLRHYFTVLQCFPIPYCKIKPT